MKVITSHCPFRRPPPQYHSNIEALKMTKKTFGDLTMRISQVRSFLGRHVVCKYSNARVSLILKTNSASHYPRMVDTLGKWFNQRNLPELVHQFLYLQDNPDNDQDIEDIPLTKCLYLFDITDVSVFHSAQATFFTPSNPSGVHGMY